mgnify:FL=1
MATRRNVPNKGIDGGRIQVPYANGSRFFAPLTKSVTPTRGMWPITFSRATTATVEDNEGVVRYVKSGEARFKWARRVENGFPFSQELTNASWQKQELTPTLSSEKVSGIPVYTLTDNAVNNTHYIRYAYPHIAWNIYLMSCIVKSGTFTNVQLAPPGGISLEYANFDLSNGTITGGNTSQATITPVSGATGYYRISLYYTSLITSAQVTWLVMINSPTAPRVQTYVGTGSTILATAMQIEDVTGQSIKTPAEYVSTNVLSSPFHGAMVDGVKYFDTDISGNQLSPDGYLAEWQKTNLFTDSEDFSLWTKAGTWVITPNATIAPDGRMTADLFTLSSTLESQALTKTVTTSASIYGDSLYVKPNGHYYLQVASATAISSGHVNFDLLNWVVWTSSNSWGGRIEVLANGWFRIKVTTNVVNATTDIFIYRPVPAANSSRNASVQWDWTSGLYLWWAQLEVGASSSYIPSTLGTRNDDILEYQLRNLESRKWTVYVETTNYFTSNNVALLWLTGGSCRILWSSVTAPWFIRSGTQVVTNDGSSNLLSSNSVAVSQYDRVLWKYSWSSQEICLNGTLTSGTFDGTTSYTNLYIGNAWVSRWLYGSIRNLQIWDYEISDAEAVALTTL